MTNIETVESTTGHMKLSADELKNLRQLWLELLPRMREHPQNSISTEEGSTLGNIEKTFWRFVLYDHPDSLMLKFLRARKFDTLKARDMLLGALEWRIKEDVDNIVEKGEASLNQSLLQNGLAHFRGRDRVGRPLCMAYVHHWHPKAQSLNDFKQYIIWTLETGRLLIETNNDGKMSAIIDTSGFSMSKVDLAAAHFLVNCMEAYYPECLGNLYIVDAPWVFSGFWKMISPLLDPVIKSKIIFCKRKDLRQYLNPKEVMKCIGGDDPYEYQYIPPTAEELASARTSPSPEKRKAQQTYWRAAERFATITESWAIEPNRFEQEREEAALQFKQACIELQPFVRASTFYHRIEEISQYR
ncbi:CRAL/TRIO domain-containing protein, partial [Basidiobolus meristosporus CBS 931.73]